MESETEQAAWRQVAALVFRLPGALDVQLQRDAEISHFEYMVLSGLSEAPVTTVIDGFCMGLAKRSFQAR